jgi:peptidyl-prolyl cis-trans isomerase D
MFDFVREKKRLVQIVLALIVLPFAFWGMDSYNRSTDTEAPATVNGVKISQQEFENAMRQQQERLRKMFEGNIDKAMLDNPEMKRAVMDNLIAQRLLTEQAKSVGLAVSDMQIAKIIQDIEVFQDNGRFDKKRYESELAKQNMSPPMFEARLHDEILGQQMRDAYVQNGYAPNVVTENLIRLNEQQRVVSVSSVPFQSFLDKASVDEAALKNYYEQNQKEFSAPEQARVEYVKLSADMLSAKVEVSDADARQYYDTHQGEFGSAEQRQAAHILITLPAAASDTEQGAVEAKASQLLQQAKQNPAKFSELAKLNSQDTGSAENGGDLGFFGKGMMTKPFEDAAFALKEGEISGLVKSEFGYHIIKLTAIKPAKILAFDEVRMTVINRLKQQKSTDMFVELAEKFSNTAYVQSDTLKPASDLANTKIEQSGWLSRGMATDDVWAANMLEAIFSDDVIKNKRNTAAIEVAPNTLVAARILEYKPAAIRALSEVQETIRKKLLQKQAIELAVKHGKTMLENLQQGKAPAIPWNPAQIITRAQNGALDIGVVRQIFQANTAKLPVYVGAEIAQTGYMLVRIDAVKETEIIDDAKRKGYAQQLRQLAGEEIFQAYLSDAMQQATIKIKTSDKTAQQ